jgi:putative transposase
VADWSRKFVENISKYGGMEASDIKRLKELEDENRRLKQMYAELSLDHKILKDIVEKKL